MNTEQERAEFEAACRGHVDEAGYDEEALNLTRDGDGYIDKATQAAWWGWREGRAALQSQATEAFPCRIVEADFETGTVTLEMHGKYTVSSGQKYLCDAPLQSQDREDVTALKVGLEEAAQTMRAVLAQERLKAVAKRCLSRAIGVCDRAIDHARRAEGDVE